jgi:hypothetical protein
MTSPWAEYIRSSKKHPHLFYRDVVHANEYGEQILAKIMMAGGFYNNGKALAVSPLHVELYLNAAKQILASFFGTRSPGHELRDHVPRLGCSFRYLVLPRSATAQLWGQRRLHSRKSLGADETPLRPPPTT